MSGVPRSTHDGTPGSYDVISMASLLCDGVRPGGRRQPDPRTQYGRAAPADGRVTLAAMAEPRVLDAFSDRDVASVLALAEAVETQVGASPFGEVTWSGLAGRSTLGDRGVLLAGDDGDALAYAHLAHHRTGEWSVEIAARPGAEHPLP